MIKIAICDDDDFICNQLKNILIDIEDIYLEKLDIKIFHSGIELDHSIQHRGGYDIIFLDIEMEQMNGVEVGKKLRNEYEEETTEMI